MSKTTKIVAASFILLVGIMVLLCLLLGIPLAQTIYNDRVLDNKMVYLNCDQLPDIKQVESAVKEHNDVIEKLEEINPGLIFVETHSKDDCPDKGFLLIVFGGHEDREKIEALLGETFFGIPYQLENH